MVQEAIYCNLPTIGICDSDSDPTVFTYPVPGNDDSQITLDFYLGHFVAAIREGKVMLGCMYFDVGDVIVFFFPRITHNRWAFILTRTNKHSMRVSSDTSFVSQGLPPLQSVDAAAAAGAGAATSNATTSPASNDISAVNESAAL